MEVSALRYSGGIGLHGRSPLLRLQSDERLIAMIRRGNPSAFEVLVSRYHSRLLAFCRHLLGSREDAEDILQEVFAAAFNAILADDRPINVRPWLYRIARNRSLNHLRRIQAIGVDSMDVHFSENGATTADKVHDREQFRLLVGDIHGLPETQRTALVLREMDALSYEQIAEAMDTTVPGVKSLLVRARISLAEAAEARTLTCEDVRLELAEVAEGLQRRPGPLVRRHLRTCRRCSSFQGQLKRTNKALAALLPLGPLALLRKVAIIHLSHGTGSGATAAGATTATGATGAGASGAAAVAGTAGGGAALGGTGGVISAGAGALATKAAGALAAAAIVTAGAVEASHTVQHHPRPLTAFQPAEPHSVGAAPVVPARALVPDQHLASRPAKHKAKVEAAKPADKTAAASKTDPAHAPKKTDPAHAKTKTAVRGRVQTQTDPTVLATPSVSADTGKTGATSPTSAGAAIPASPASSTDGTTGPTGPTGPTPSPSASGSPSGSSSSSSGSPSGSSPSSSGATSGSSGTTPDPSGGTGAGPSGPTGPSGPADSLPPDPGATPSAPDGAPLP